MRPVLLVVLSIMLLSNSCRKNSKPDYYFQCQVDGQTYIPNSCANCMVAKLLGDTTLLLNGNRGFESIGIGIIKLDKVPVSTGTYVLNDNPQQSADYDNSPQVDDIYRTDKTKIGSLSILILDKTNNIISGTFQFLAFNAVRNKTVSITSGEFRLKYSTN